MGRWTEVSQLMRMCKVLGAMYVSVVERADGNLNNKLNRELECEENVFHKLTFVL